MYKIIHIVVMLKHLDHKETNEIGIRYIFHILIKNMGFLPLIHYN